MLSIKKVVLFKHGVGYFEREGQVSDDASIDLYFRVQEMNDVLKSLTVLDMDGGVITSISYESTLLVEEQLNDIAIRLPGDNALSGLLSQVQGARVSVQIGQKTVAGVVTGIETLKRQTGQVVLDTTYISLLVEGGTLQSFDVMEAKQITLLDDNLKKDLQHLLEVLIASKKKDLKKLTIFFKGEGKRTINISYIVAAPVWKTSYRLLLNEESPLIQGWAVVDNTRDEDWENVSLSLVAGLPVSFIHDLYSPRYQRRPEVRVNEETAYAPPKSEKAIDSRKLTLDDSVEDVHADLAISAEMADVPAPTMDLRRRDALESSVPVRTRTVEVGDLFQYEIENPVTVPRQQSALVPILQACFSGKRVAVYNSEIRYTNPMSAVLFENTTGLTLESGPVTVFENDAYLGEAMLNTLKPGEEQLVSYSVELGCIVSSSPFDTNEDVHHIQITDGRISMYHYEVNKITYIINNKTGRDIDFYLEHRHNRGWDLIDTQGLVERTEYFYRFHFDVPTGATHEFTVKERILRSSGLRLKDTSRENLKLWFERKYIDDKTRSTLEVVVNLSEKITQIQRVIKAKENTVEVVFKNQERIRENLRALGDTENERSLRDRYVSNLDNEEDQLAKIETEIEDLRTQRTDTEKQLNTQLKSIEFEAKL